MILYKYTGAGNDFLIVDNRKGDADLDRFDIVDLCDRHYGVGADGLMFLGKGRDGYDFTMDYYNSDGSGGMMCGNGGRCIVAFAYALGIEPSSADGRWNFLAPDGPHEAFVLEKVGRRTRTIRLKMKDISDIKNYPSISCAEDTSGWFVDTGTRHFVTFVPSAVNADFVDAKGRLLRNAEEFSPQGVNVNFVIKGNPLKVRTFEKGVEAETCACGTGIVASAVAAFLEGVEPASVCAETGSVHYDIKALNDSLAVDFVPAASAGKISGKSADSASDAPEAYFTDVWLTGPASFVAEVNVLL